MGHEPGEAIRPHLTVASVMELGLSRGTRLKNRSAELSVAVLSLTSLLYNLAGSNLQRCPPRGVGSRALTQQTAGPLSTFALRSGDESEISSPGNCCPGSRACSLASAQGSGQPRGHTGCFQVELLPVLRDISAWGTRCSQAGPLRPTSPHGAAPFSLC